MCNDTTSFQVKSAALYHSSLPVQIGLGSRAIGVSSGNNNNSNRSGKRGRRSGGGGGSTSTTSPAEYLSNPMFDTLKRPGYGGYDPAAIVLRPLRDLRKKKASVVTARLMPIKTGCKVL